MAATPRPARLARPLGAPPRRQQSRHTSRRHLAILGGDPARPWTVAGRFGQQGIGDLHGSSLKWPGPSCELWTPPKWDSS